MKFFVSITFLFFTFLVRAQAEKTNDFEEAEILMETGTKLVFEEKKAAYSNFEAAYDLFKKHQAWLRCIKALQKLCWVSHLHYDLANYGSTLHRIDSIFNTHSTFFDTIKESRTLKNLHLTNKADYHKKINDYPKSLEYSQQVIFNVNSIPDSQKTVTDLEDIYIAYEFKAGIYTAQGKYDLAKDFYHKCLRLGKNGKLNESFMAPTLELLGGLLNKQEKYGKSNEYYLRYLNSRSNDTKASNNRILSSYFVIAQNHIRLGQIDSATYYLSRARRQLSKNDVLEHRYHQIKGELYQAIGNYKEALKSMDTSIVLLSSTQSMEHNFELARLYKKKAVLQIEQKKYTPALEHLQLAMGQISKDFSARTGLWPDPELKDVVNKEELINILKYKALALNELKEYDLTLNSIELGVQALDDLKPSLKSEADKLFLIEEAFPLFESGMAAAYAMYKTSKNVSYIDQAFRYSEKSKAVLLLEALLSAQATDFAKVPEKLLEKERQLKSGIAYIEKKINTDKDKFRESEDELFALKNEYRNLVRTIETNYPSYYDLKYSTRVVSGDQLQNGLGADDMLLTYFYGNEAIYALAIDKNGKQIKQIAKDSALETKITKTYRQLTDPKSDPVALGKATQSLYAELVAPFLRSKDRKKLIIIADGLLNYIPFGCMNTSENDIRYLVEDHTISYANSATLLTQLMERPPRDDAVLAFAPEFDYSPDRGNDQVVLLPLPNNKKEVEGIMDWFDGNAFFDENASLNTFKSQISNFGIVHLATHAVFDDRSPEYSYLAFSPIKDEPSLLYVRDLYNLELEADLVTLSACESGLGELRHGEGFLSLARGFFYSGASSLSSTLWKITDASSTRLMDGFYRNLSEGNPKDLALQRSQVDYLDANRQNALAHPYYWSGFIISGNTDPVVASHNWWEILLGGIILLLVGIRWYRKWKVKVQGTLRDGQTTQMAS